MYVKDIQLQSSAGIGSIIMAEAISSNIVEVDQCFLLAAAGATTQEDAEIFFASVEKLLEERIRAVEAEAGADKEPAEGDVVVQTKVINVSRTSQQNNQQMFCWGTFISDSGSVEKRTFVN